MVLLTVSASFKEPKCCHMSMPISAAHILNLNHNQLTVSFNTKRKSISASSSSSFNRYSFNYDISRSFGRISYSSPVRIRPLNPLMEWQNCTVKMEVDEPVLVAYKCYSNREAIPEWMPYISSVKVWNAMFSLVHGASCMVILRFPSVIKLLRQHVC